MPYIIYAIQIIYNLDISKNSFILIYNIREYINIRNFLKYYRSSIC